MSDSLPLYKRAQLGLLSDHQYMDPETLTWMKEQLDIEGLRRVPLFFIKNIDIDLIKQHFPRGEWFLKRKQSESTHGLRHLMRVVIYVDLILKIISYDKPKHPLLLSAAVHDIGRINDRKDKGHGLRSFSHFKKYFSKNLLSYSENDLSVVQNMCEFHESSYEQIPDRILDQYTKEIDVIKAADALDRFRLPKKKWWPSKEYLRLNIPSELFQFSKLLVYYSEYNYCVRKKDAQTAVILALEKIINKNGNKNNRF